MKRKAIIIGSNFDTTIPGVVQDLIEWKKFLISPWGGAWEPAEIETIENATTSTLVLEAIAKATDVDYAFIAFSGHGGIYRPQKDDFGYFETFIYLNETDCLSERQLNPGANCHRCTIVLDCCRKHGSELYTFSKGASSLENIINYDARELSRKLFDDQLEKSEKGCVRIYATGLGYAAADEESFSRIMMDSAKKYFQSPQEANILTLKDAVRLAQEEMKPRDPQQKPQYICGRRLHHFPFAVNPIILG